jgi:hypothetical protein
VNNSTFFNVPKSTIVSTDDGTVEFESVVEYSVGRLYVQGGGEFDGKVYYEFDAICKNVGSSGNIATNSLTKIVSSITNNNGLSIVVRNDAASGGFDEEDETSMKKRFQKYLVSLRRGTREAIDFALLSNVNFTGFLYNIDEYKPLYILKQDYPNYSRGINSSNIFTDLYYDNKFLSSYNLIDFVDSDPGHNDGTLDFALYFGYDEKFYNILTVTSFIPASFGNYYVIGEVSYWNGSSWVSADVTQQPAPNSQFITDQYISWNLNDANLWLPRTIQKYTGYFVRISFGAFGISEPPAQPVTAIKTMTYPFPGYVDIYCLKNFRYGLIDSDKEIITEALENYKAAGTIVSVSNASLVNLYPTVVIYTLPGGQPPPSTIVDDIRADIKTYSESLNVAVDFNRNDLYALLYRKYINYGSLFVYYDYDNDVYESGNNYKEFYKNLVIFNASKNEKIDFPFVDVYVIDSLNYLDNINLVTDKALTNVVGIEDGDYDTNYGNFSY